MQAITKTSIDVASEAPPRKSASHVGPSLALVALTFAATAAGCAAPNASGVGGEAAAASLERAAAPPASLTPEAVVAGRPTSVGSFCDALVSFFQRSGSFDQSLRLYKQAETLVKQAKNQPDAGVNAAVRAVHLSCAARYGFEPDDSWAWNEYNISQALLLLGQAEPEPELLRLALQASSSAADVFQPSDEGWGWSRYGAGQSAHSLWRLEKADPYLDKSADVLRQVVGNEVMPAEVVGYVKLKLSDVLMDSYERTWRKEMLDEARQLLLSLEQQDQFKEDAQGMLERLQTLSRSA